MDKRFWWWSVVVAVVVLIGAPSVGEELELEIRVAPQTLVVDSAGGGVTVHTDFRYVEFRDWEQGWAMILVQDEPFRAGTYVDSRGFLVAKISKADVVEAVSFEGVTTAVVELALFDDDLLVARGAAVIAVKP